MGNFKCGYYFEDVWFLDSKVFFYFFYIRIVVVICFVVWVKVVMFVIKFILKNYRLGMEDGGIMMDVFNKVESSLYFYFVVV